MHGEQGNVLAPVAQRRQVQLDDIETEEEVFAEISLGDHFGQVAVRRGEEADVGGEGFVAADALEDAFAEHTEDFNLRGGIDLADLVEKQRAARGLLEASDAPLARSGERTFLVAEEFAFEELR